MNGEIEGYTRSNNYTAVFLEADADYSFSISAYDACGNASDQSGPVSARTKRFQGAEALINPEGLEYLGAITLSETFNWGGEAIAYNRDGDGGQSSSGTDNFPGSLFVTNLNQPENGLVGEVNIPAPVISLQKSVEDLTEAGLLTQPVDIRPANVNNWEYVDIWRTGLEYIPKEGRLYSSWSIHYTVTEEKHASISCCNAADLSGSARHGAWYVGDSNQPPLDAMINDWLFSVPQFWADINCTGRNLIVGRCRDGGLSGLGPTLYAFSKMGTTLPSADNILPFTTLLEYGSVQGTDNYNYPNSIDGYKHSDDWREAIWVSTENQSAVAVVGNKSLGHNWYGYYGEWMRHDWVIADMPYPEFYTTDPDGKGWRGHNRQPMIIFYNPDDLAKVARGQMQSYEPQPYAAFRIPKEMFFGKDFEIFSAAFDSENSVLFVTEFVREMEGKLIIHTWKVNKVITSVKLEKQIPLNFRLNQNYPNPFNNQTMICFEIPNSAFVQLKIYNIRGEEIRTLVNRQVTEGVQQAMWDGKDEFGNVAASGIYIYQLAANNYSKARKIILLE